MRELSIARRALRRVYTSRPLRPYFRARYYRGPRPLKVIVVGSPRAGTSFVTGMVQRMGFHLGPEQWLRPADTHNRHGYFECLPLTRLSLHILQKLGGDFHHLPRFEPGWQTSLEREKEMIASLVESGGIELLKDNHLLVLADLYADLFPQARWIYVLRDVQETYRSRFGEHMSLDEWRTLSARRLALWHASRPASRALHLDYAEFKQDLASAIERVSTFLEIDLSPAQRRACMAFFQPRTEGRGET